MPKDSGEHGAVPYSPSIQEQFAPDGMHPLVRGWYWDDTNTFYHSMCILPVLKRKKFKKASPASLRSPAHKWYTRAGTLAGPSFEAWQVDVALTGVWMERNGHTPPVRVADSADFESRNRVPVNTWFCGYCLHGGSSCPCKEETVEGTCIILLN